MKKARKNLSFCFIILLFVGFTTSTSSCARKVGCAVEEQVGPKVNKDGTLSLKRGKSQLFGKKHRKRMKKTRGK